MARVPRICVVGSVNVDLTFRAPRLPRAGETLSGNLFHLGMGGKGANQAVAAARLGAKVSLVARVGNDTFGKEALRRFGADSIDTDAVGIDEQRPTGTAGIVVDDAAENCIIVVAGANAGLSAQDVRTASPSIQNSEALLCQLETPLEATLEAFRLARSAGVRTVLTPAPAQALPQDLFHLSDLCIPNETEVEFLTGRKVATIADAEVAARQLHERGIAAVLVTLGSRGALLLENDQATHIPAIEVSAVDPTGAGDAFAAATAVFWSEGMSLENAVRRANLVASLTVTRLGTQTAFPFRGELKD